MTKPDDLITVCDSCLCASCWQGESYCLDARNAGSIQMRRDALERKGLENPSYLKTDEELAKR